MFLVGQFGFGGFRPVLECGELPGGNLLVSMTMYDPLNMHCRLVDESVWFSYLKVDESGSIEISP